MYKLIEKIKFNDYININSIKNYKYFDQFTNIRTSEIQKFPKNIQHLTFTDVFKKEIDDFNSYIPKSITHLKLHFSFNKKIKQPLPNFITHLYLGYYFDNEINNILPDYITHLVLVSGFKIIKKCLPNSLTHLCFVCFYENITDFIPNSVTHLYFGYNFYKEIKGHIPDSVKYIFTNNKDYYEKIKKQMANLNIVYHNGPICDALWS
jgi:hypothetical protein